jgi:hypothetical protein
MEQGNDWRLAYSSAVFLREAGSKGSQLMRLAISSDATGLLKKTNCYGGDCDVGIPWTYKSGTILAI